MSETEKLIMIRVFTRIAERITPSKKVKPSSMMNLLVTFSGPSKTFKKPINGAGIVWERTQQGTWILRRMPFFRNKVAEAAITPTWKDGNSRVWSEWTLWDGRWWIRARALDPGVKDVVIRPMSEDDMEMLRKYKIQRLHEGVDSLGGDEIEFPPGKFRFTLPLICATVDKNKDVMIGLPSLQIHLLNQRNKEVGAPKLVAWECEFRQPI